MKWPLLFPLFYLQLMVVALPLSAQSNDSLQMERVYDLGVKAKQQMKHDSALWYFQQVHDWALAEAQWEMYFSSNKQFARIWRDSQLAPFDAAALLDSLIPLSRDRLGADAVGTGELVETLANTYQVLGLFQEAIANYQESLRIRRLQFGAQSERVMVSYLNLIRLFNRNGHYEKALTYATLSLKMLHSLEGPPSRFTADVYQLYARALGHTKGNAQKEVYLLKAVDWCMETGRIASGKGTSLYFDLYLLYRKQERFVEAQSMLDAVRKLVTGKISPQHPLFGQVHLYEAQLQMERGDYARSHELLALAEQIFSVPTQSVGIYLANTLHTRGEVLFREKRYEEALLAFHQSLQPLCLNFEASDPRVNPAVTVFSFARGKLLTAIYNKGLCYVEMARMAPDSVAQIQAYENAFRVLEDAQAFLHQLRTTLPESEDQATLLVNRYRIFELAMTNVWELYALTKDPRWMDAALQISEQSRANRLRGAWQEGAVGLPDSPLSDQENRLESEIHLNRNQWVRERNKGTDASLPLLDSLQLTIGQLYQQRDSLQAAIKLADPVYYQLRYQLPATKLETVQARLSQGKRLLNYFMADSVLFTLDIQQGKRTFSRRLLPHSLPDSLKRWRRGLEDPHYLEAAAFQQLGRFLAQWVLPDSLLATTRELIVLPSGLLHFLPFELLPIGTEQAQDYGEIHYLGQIVPMRSIFAVWTLETPPRLPVQATRYWAGFAPEYSPTTSLEEPTTYASRLLPGPLPGARAEVDQIAQVISGEKFVGPSVSKALFLAQATQSQILHLAMHAYADHQRPLASGLLFTQDQALDTLPAHEIYQLNLAAELTVLSACNTGLGMDQKGEGVLSLAHAFAYAGCPSIVMTLWPVNDQSSEFLMEAFYRALNEGFDKAQALQMARQHYLNTHDQTHPYYWGSFVLVGDNAAISTPTSAPWPYLLGVLAILLILLLWLRRNRQKSNWK